jgi:hypothetical protein
MENAGKAMKAIRGGMTMEKVDSTLCVYYHYSPSPRRKKERTHNKSPLLHFYFK